MKITDDLIFTAIQTAHKAGIATMEVYREPFEVEFKSDHSPLTLADKKAHSIIVEGLSETGLALLSEEGKHIGFDIRKNWVDYWLVDPLDGTKEFIKKNGDFTVNIALISHQQPVLGVVFAPVPGFIYWGSENGSFRLNANMLEESIHQSYSNLLAKSERLPCISGSGGFHVLGSRSHLNSETETFIKNLQLAHPDLSFVSRGSSLKFCTLAEGGADIYPRFSPTMEWDTAAGQAVAVFAGCTVTQAGTGYPMIYNKQSLLNPFFIAERKKK
jgi:3'(2'), 5'-bisphosphate nucleotidase